MQIGALPQGDETGLPACRVLRAAAGVQRRQVGVGHEGARVGLQRQQVIPGVGRNVQR